MASVDEEARQLAEKHYEVEEGVRLIFQLTQNAEFKVTRGEKIALLEVNESTIPTGIMPLEFGPAPASGIHYPSVIVEITPEEFEAIQSKELALPEGWCLGPEITRHPSLRTG